MDDLLAEQAPSGAFPCVIDWGGGRSTRDENGFATALVLRRIRRLRWSFPGLDRALDFLESCAAEPPGAFAFWPPTARPPWAAGIPPDADDTAVITLELYACGRRSRDQAVATVTDVLVPATARLANATGPPWLRPGVFPTWLRVDGVDRDTVVDCGVNTNVAGLLAAVDARDAPGYAAAVEMVDAAAAWCDQPDPAVAAQRVDLVAPYYASARALAHVVDDAVWCGATELAPAGERLARIALREKGPGDALWRNAYGGPTWRCRALRLLPEPPSR